MYKDNPFIHPMLIYIVYYGAIWHKAIVAIKLERPSDNIKNDNVVLQRPHLISFGMLYSVGPFYVSYKITNI